MYSVVLLAALATGGNNPAWCHGCHGCHGCYGCYGCHGCYGCCGCWGGYGCYGCYGCCGGCWGCYGCCGGCWGCYGCWGGCWGCYSACGCCGGWGGAVIAAPAAGGDAAPRMEDRRDDKKDDKKQTRAASPFRAKLVVSLPADAKLYIDDNLTKATSGRRTFNTPTLQNGQLYYYVLRAEMVRDGKTVRETKRVLIRAGELVRARFDEPKAKDQVVTKPKARKEDVAAK